MTVVAKTAATWVLVKVETTLVRNCTWSKT